MDWRKTLSQIQRTNFINSHAHLYIREHNLTPWKKNHLPNEVFYNECAFIKNNTIIEFQSGISNENFYPALNLDRVYFTTKIWFLNIEKKDVADFKDPSMFNKKNIRMNKQRVVEAFARALLRTGFVLYK